MSLLIANRAVQVGDRVQVRIDRLSYNGGRGVGRLDGLVMFVPDTAPQDLVEVEITQLKKNFAEARLIQVLESSPLRRTPPCAVATKCGGCMWQHVQYDEQLRQKEQFLRHNIDLAYRRAKQPQDPFEIRLVAAPQEFRYRNRVQVHVEHSNFGFYAKNSRELVPITDCLITESALLVDFPAKLADGNYEVSFDEFGARTIRPLGNEGPSFAQVNSQQNIALQMTVSDYTTSLPTCPKRFFDFYCGSGNFSFPILYKIEAIRVTGVEFSKPAIERALAKVKRENLESRAQFIAGDVHDYLKSLSPNDARDAIFTLDPPRVGLGKNVIFELSRLMPQGLIYISCDLGSLERDISLLVPSFTLKKVTAIDMFPQTEYLETACLLVPRVAQN